MKAPKKTRNRKKTFDLAVTVRIPKAEKANFMKLVREFKAAYKISAAENQ